MAKDKGDKSDKGGKIRVLVFELEGSDETLQESLRTVANALGRSLVSNRISEQSPSQRVLPKDKTVKESVAEDIEYEEDAEEVVVTTTPKSTSKRNTVRTYRTPQILDDINFKGGKITLEAFCQQKNPETDTARYLVCAAWLKENLGIDPIGPDHIYTCFRFLHWGVQKDLSQPFRSGKKPGYYKSATEKSMFSITHIGLNEVEKMNQ